MPSFLRDLRRKSRASFKPDDTPDDSASSSGKSEQNAQHQTLAARPVQNRSSSTLSSFFGGSTEQTPNSHVRSKSNSNLAHIVTGPEVSTPSINGTKTPPLSERRLGMPVNGSSSNRYSIAGSVNSSPRATMYTSPLAPRVSSVSEGSWVHQKVLLVSGTIGEFPQQLDGQIVVYHHQDTFPPTTWPVCDSHFKILVHLQPGPNRLRLDYLPSRKPSASSQPAHSSWVNINHLPLISSPPLHLVILAARDSPMLFDSPPDRARTEGNGIETAIKKFRMAAYLWQAFTGEQMNRNGFGRRCFRYEEEWQTGTLSNRDRDKGQMRNEAKVHVIRMDKTLAEIRDLDIAQQYGPATRKGDLFSIALDTVKRHFSPSPGQKQYVSCMFIDSQWDRNNSTIRGHAALGGGDGTLQLAVFGSQALWSYPTHLEEVVPAFSDCTRTDIDHVANDLNESGSTWEAANIGIGAHMHETGHLFGCPHQESGVMLRDYVRLNRTFTCREPYSTRTKSQGLRLCQTSDECDWHRLDILRFRHHPCFQLPNDQALVGEEGIQVWAVDNGNALITVPTGLAFIEIFLDKDDICHHWLEYIDPMTGGAGPRQVTLTEQDLRARVGETAKGKKLRIKIFSCGQADHEIADFCEFVGNTSRIKLPDGRAGYKGSKLGFSNMNGTEAQQVITHSNDSNKLLVSVRVYSGFAFDGIEFVFENGERRLFGKRGGDGVGQDFALDVRRGEGILGFFVRAGVWVDGIQILTNSGRKSEFFGNKDGGSGVSLIPPRGYNFVGLYGTCGQWVDGFGLIISR